MRPVPRGTVLRHLIAGTAIIIAALIVVSPAAAKGKKMDRTMGRVGDGSSAVSFLTSWGLQEMNRQNAPYCWRRSYTKFSKRKKKAWCPPGSKRHIGRCYYGDCRNGWNLGSKGKYCYRNRCPKGYRRSGSKCKKRGKRSISRRSMRKYVTVGCPPGMKLRGGTCVPGKCRAGYENTAGVCWQSCTKGHPKACGAGCSVNKAACDGAVANMVVTPILVAADLVVTVLSAGSAKGISQGAKQGARQAIKTAVRNAASRGSKAKVLAAIRQGVKRAKNALKDLVAASLQKKLKVLGKDMAATVVENVASSLALAAIAGEMTQYEGAQKWVELAASLDPTGIASIVQAFDHPKCGIADLPTPPKGACRSGKQPTATKMVRSKDPFHCERGVYTIAKDGRCLTCGDGGAVRTMNLVTSSKACFKPGWDDILPQAPTVSSTRSGCPKGSKSFRAKDADGKRAYRYARGRKTKYYHCVKCKPGYKPKYRRGKGSCKKKDHDYQPAIVDHRAGMKCPKGYERDLKEKWWSQKACAPAFVCPARSSTVKKADSGAKDDKAGWTYTPGKPCRVCLYSGFNYTGKKRCFSPGKYRLGNLNNRVSSIKFDVRGCKRAPALVLYENRFSGHVAYGYKNMPNLKRYPRTRTRNWNDDASSIRFGLHRKAYDSLNRWMHPR